MGVLCTYGGRRILPETYTDSDSETDTDMYDVHLYKQVLSGKRINPIIEMGNGPK